MPKIKLIAAAFFFLATLSCRKDRTCECTENSSSSHTNTKGAVSNTNQNPITTTTNFKKVKKIEIEVECSNYKQTTTSVDTSGTTTIVSDIKCSIK